MQFAVMQTSLDKPDIEALRRAFGTLDYLTDMDAHIIANDAYGILLKNLAHSKALALQAALRRENINSEIVPHNDLPVLPNAKIVRRIDCLPEHLLIFDALNRSFPVEWRYVMMIAVGKLPLSQWRRKAIKRLEFNYHGSGYEQAPRIRTDYTTREERKLTFVVEIIMQRAVLRYSIKENHLLFHYLKDRAKGNKYEKYKILIQDLTRLAPQAAINRGAFYMREGERLPFQYPSKNAFYEEILWLLWRLRRAGKW